MTIENSLKLLNALILTSEKQQPLNKKIKYSNNNYSDYKNIFENAILEHTPNIIEILNNNIIGHNHNTEEAVKSCYYLFNIYKFGLLNQSKNVLYQIFYKITGTKLFDHFNQAYKKIDELKIPSKCKFLDSKVDDFITQYIDTNFQYWADDILNAIANNIQHKSLEDLILEILNNNIIIDDLGQAMEACDYLAKIYQFGLLNQPKNDLLAILYRIIGKELDYENIDKLTPAIDYFIEHKVEKVKIDQDLQALGDLILNTLASCTQQESLEYLGSTTEV